MRSFNLIDMLKTKPSNSLISHNIPSNFPQSHQQYLFLAQKFVSLLLQCCSLKSLKQIHAQMILNSVHKPNFLLPKIIHFKDFTYASLYFARIPSPNEYSFNVMIRGLTTTWRNYSLAVQLYYQMKFAGLMPNNFTYPFLFMSCANLQALKHGENAHSMVLKIGLDKDNHVNHSLITMYFKCGEPEYARQVFDEIHERDVVSWNSMISGCSKMGFAQEAVKLFMDMREQGFEPDEMTLVSVLAACGDVGNLSLGKWVEEFVHKKKLELNTYVGSSLIGMYGKCGDLLSARRIFDAMEKKDVITWNAMITGYSQNGESNEAITLFNLMREDNVIPNQVTIVVVLSACASIGALDLGILIEHYASQRGFQYDVYVGSALIDMYAKCGTIENAIRVFESMPYKNEVSWNAMISAFAFHGRANEAISLFRRFLTDNTSKPNDITFVGLLSACVHAGLVDEGRRLFYAMNSTFGLVPKIEHYSCMVDLLGRAGHLNEAWNLIEKMPGKPDAIVLGSLLGACQKRRNVDISERVTKLLLEMEPSNSGNYIIQSKIYANLRMWDESGKMRALMRQQGVTKVPGCSWIEIGSGFREFHAGDVVDNLTREMHRLLIEEMKREGYVVRVDLT